MSYGKSPLPPHRRPRFLVLTSETAGETFSSIFGPAPHSVFTCKVSSASPIVHSIANPANMAERKVRLTRQPPRQTPAQRITHRHLADLWVLA